MEDGAARGDAERTESPWALGAWSRQAVRLVMETVEAGKLAGTSRWSLRPAEDSGISRERG